MSSRPLLLQLALVAALLAACGAADTSSPPAPTLATVATQPAAYPAMQCTSISAPPLDTDYLSRMPFGKLTEGDWRRGPADAPITLLVYSDFQCQSCREFADTLARLQERYPDEVQVFFRHYPLIGTPELPVNDKAAQAAIAAEAAGAQGKFWEMHDLLFATQTEWAALSPDAFDAWLLTQAAQLELDVELFSDAVASEGLQHFAQTAWENGQSLQIGTPPFLIFNDGPHSGPIDFESLNIIIQLDKLAERQFHTCPDMQLERGRSYIATLETPEGDIVVELFPEAAPWAVNSFVFLAQQDWFKDITFHRVLPGFVAQAGDPSGTGYGGPGYAFAIEPHPSLTFDRPGLLAMANAGPTSNGSQFFITYGPAPHLNGGYTIFGQVIQGMDIVEGLTPRDPAQAVGLPPGDQVLNITIEVH